MPNDNVVDFLVDRKPGERVALELLERNVTYGELRAAVRCVAQYLRAIGGEKGDRVLLLADNSLFWVASYLGIMQAGLVAVPLPGNTEDLGYILADTESRIAFVQRNIALKQCGFLHGIHVVTDVEMPRVANFVTQAAFPALLRNLDGSEAGVAARGDDLAALMFTSGSTGRPRGVMISHANIMANTESIVQYLRLSSADRIMTVLPFHYCFGTSLLHTHLRVGGTLIIDNRFQYPEAVVQRMDQTECTGFAGVPSHYQILLRRSSLRNRSFPRLRYVQQAGGHLAPKFVRELQAALPNTQIFIMYGQTEATARLAYMPPHLVDTKSGSIGVGIPGVRLQVLDENGEPVQPGEVGEIVAEGRNIARGYWRAPSESAVSFRGGKLYTGDLATIDEDGFVYVKDRAKDFLKCGGNRVSCREVEDRLLEFGGIVEAAVIGIPDDVLGEGVRAFVVPRSNEHVELHEQLQSFCSRQLAPHLIPKDIVVVAGLPKNSSGKVLKAELRKPDWRQKEAFFVSSRAG